MIQFLNPSKLKGTILIPSSKSDAQRAILIAALSEGKSQIVGIGQSDDEQAMLQAVQGFGTSLIHLDSGGVEISGVRETSINCSVSSYESGLGFRLLVGALSSFEGEKTIQAEGSLLSRTMEIYEQILPKMGVEINTKNGFPPIRINGKLKAGKYEIDGSISSQFISGLLVGLCNLKAESTLQINHLVSKPYVEMTIKTLKSFGARIEEIATDTFSISKSTLMSTNYTIEADWSSASYWLVASALGQDVSCTNLNLESLQADKALLEAFRLANCTIEISDEIRINGTQRKAFEFDASNCPDLFPALVVFAAGIEGVTKITGIERLIHKESNRALTLQSEFGKLGLKIDLIENEMVIHGTGKLTGGKVHSHNDHRIAMSLAIASCLATDSIEIDGAEAVSKSYPTFWEEFEQVLS